MECPDGQERRCFPLLAMHVCDHKEALKACNTKKTHCTACLAKEGQLHQSHSRFTRKTTEEMQRLYEENKTSLVDKKDTPLFGMKSEMERFESEKFGGCRCALSTHTHTFHVFLFVLLFVLL